MDTRQEPNICHLTFLLLCWPDGKGATGHPFSSSKFTVLAGRLKAYVAVPGFLPLK